MTPETFRELAARYGEPGEEPAVRTVSLAHCLATGADPEGVLGYLRGLGVAVHSLDDLAGGIGALDDEEELSAHRVAEGVAIGHASDGWWLLFTP